MNRRRFLSNTATSLLVGGRAWWPVPSLGLEPAPLTELDESVVGKPVDLGRYGEWKSWLSPEASAQLREWRTKKSGTNLKSAELPRKAGEFDLGVEWGEYRAIHEVVIRYAAEAKAPRPDRQALEYWNGKTPLQGSWVPLEYWLDQPAIMSIEQSTWTYNFVSPWLIFKLEPIRTCKIRIRFQEPRNIEITDFAIHGPALWRSGEIYVEWGHAGPERPHDGHLEAYNAEVLEIRPWQNTQIRSQGTWSSVAGGKQLGGISVKLLYTTGKDVDRSALTLHTKAGDFSFLPAEALDEQPIEVPEFGVYIRNAQSKLNRIAYRQQNAGKFRILDAVARHPEQNIEAAYAHLKPPRTRLTFLGVDANNHKFGIRPDGHVVVGYADPSNGKAIRTPVFALHFATREETGSADARLDASLFADSNPKSVTPKEQYLQEGWLPIVTTNWTTANLAFERVDCVSLLDQPEPLYESKLLGTEPAVMISELKIRNNSPDATSARLFIRPWKPLAPTLGKGWEGPLPAELENSLTTGLKESCVTGRDGAQEYAMCLIDTHGRGNFRLQAKCNAVAYEIDLGPRGEHVIHLVIPGWLMSPAESPKLSGLPFERRRAATARYWTDRVSEGMQIQVPDVQVQNLYNASLQHFLLAFTKDAKRGEYYPNVAMFTYGAIGSESSPIIQALDMRGFHQHAEKCLQSWLATQGYFACEGDAPSKEGAFCRFWPAYTINQGFVLWALAEHYFYVQDRDWLQRVAPQIVAGCDYLIRERKRAMVLPPDGRKPITYGLAPAGCVADMRDWQSSFMLNGYYYLGLKKSAQALQAVNPGDAGRIAAEAEDYRIAIRRVLKDSVALSPVTRLRDNTSVPSIPPFPGLRGFRSELKDEPDVGYGSGTVYDAELGALHLLKCEILSPQDPEVSWMLNALEDRFFMTQPETAHLEGLETDWFNLGGFARSQPYYLHYQEAYLRRDEIPNFLRGFFNTVATSADPYTLTFSEGAFGGGAAHKTHEEAWFIHQLRFMLVMEMGDDLYLARGTPRRWLEDGKNIAVTRAPSYCGELDYQIRSMVSQGRIEATVNPPHRRQPANLYLRFRHPQQKLMQRVTLNGRPWTEFDSSKEWIKLPSTAGKVEVAAYY